MDHSATTGSTDATPDVVLASTSAHRRALLLRLGIPFRCEAPEVDEAAASEGLREPEAVARALAKAKAAAVARKHPDSVVIGSDQVCALGDEVLGKPGTEQAAVAQLLRLQGREHRLITAVAVMHRGRAERFVDTSTLRMRALSADEAQRYVTADRPLDCAGSYKIESRGIALFEAVHSHDHTAITGLPLLALCRALRQFGVVLP